MKITHDAKAVLTLHDLFTVTPPLSSVRGQLSPISPYPFLPPPSSPLRSVGGLRVWTYYVLAKQGETLLRISPDLTEALRRGARPLDRHLRQGNEDLKKKNKKKMQGTDLVQDGFERREGARERAWPTGGRKANKFGSVQMAAPANLTGLTSRQTIVVPRQYGPSPNYRYHNHHNTKPVRPREQYTATQRAGQRDRASE